MSKIKLTGESSGYVEISAGNAAGNNTLEAPTSGTRLVAHEGSQDVTLNGNLTVNGVLSYEDTTNIDSVGLVTARNGLHVTGGSVGIGTDNPGATLHVRGSSSPRIENTGTISLIRFQNSSAENVFYGSDADNAVIYTQSTERLRITSAGLVGIGTDNPDGQLTIRKQILATDNISNSVSHLSLVSSLGGSNAHQSVIHFGPRNASTNTSPAAISAIASGNTASDLTFYVNTNNNYSSTPNTEALRITSAGKVGINTASPRAVLDIEGNAENATLMLHSNDANANLQFSDNTGGARILNYGGDLAFRTGTNAHLFGTGDNEALRITSDGKLGIKVTSPGCQTGGIHAVHDATEGTPSFTGGEVGIFQRNYNSAQGCEIGIIGGSNSSSRINFGDKDDADVGIISYSHNDNSMRFIVSAAERLRITSGGNLIVDAGGETQDIQIISHSANSGHGKVYMRGNASNESSSIQLNHYGHADYHVSAGRAGNGMFSITRTDGGSDGILMGPTGNMGLGISPSYSGIFGGSQRVLHIGGTTAPGLRIQSSTSNQGDFIIQAGNSGGATYLYNQSSNADTVFYTAPSGSAKESLRISSGGELSITGAKSGNNISDAILKFNIVNSNGDGKKAEIKAVKTADVSSELIFSTTSSHTFAERMRISSHGRVGVNDHTGGWAEALQVSSLTSNGQYGIAIKIQNNSGYFMRFGNGTNNPCGSVSSSGGNSTSFNTSWSDSRRKKNFENWNEEVLPLFKTLEPKKFNFTHEDDGTEKTKGYVAQDVVNKFPEAYPLLDDTEVDEQRYMFNPSGMTVYLMKALQEEIAKREALEDQYNALADRITALEP